MLKNSFNIGKYYNCIDVLYRIHLLHHRQQSTIDSIHIWCLWWCCVCQAIFKIMLSIINPSLKLMLTSNSLPCEFCSTKPSLLIITFICSENRIPEFRVWLCVHIKPQINVTILNHALIAVISVINRIVRQCCPHRQYGLCWVFDAHLIKMFFFNWCLFLQAYTSGPVNSARIAHWTVLQSENMWFPLSIATPIPSIRSISSWLPAYHHF